MNRNVLFIFFTFLITWNSLQAQILDEQDSVQQFTLSSGWADEAVTMGFITAPTVLTLMFVSTLVNEWNAGYAGVPATVMILAVPPLIYAGGRSVDIQQDLWHPRAKLGWTLYALSVIPTSLALYGFTTDWSSTIPLTITSAIFGTASIVVMTSYAQLRAKSAREMRDDSYASLQFGISPLPGGALATIAYRF